MNSEAGAPAEAPRDEEIKLRGMLQIIMACDAPKRERVNLAGEEVLKALCKRGHFCFPTEERTFESAQYFDSVRNKTEVIKSDSFKAWLSDYLQINRADTFFTPIVTAIETEAVLKGSVAGGTYGKFGTS